MKTLVPILSCLAVVSAGGGAYIPGGHGGFSAGNFAGAARSTHGGGFGASVSRHATPFIGAPAYRASYSSIGGGYAGGLGSGFGGSNGGDNGGGHGYNSVGNYGYAGHFRGQGGFDGSRGYIGSRGYNSGVSAGWAARSAGYGPSAAGDWGGNSYGGQNGSGGYGGSSLASASSSGWWQ